MRIVMDLWDEFNSTLSETPAGNNGNLGVYLDEMEIIPFAKGIVRQNSKNDTVSSFNCACEVRAVVEGQFLAKRLHANRLGYQAASSSRLLATGGASSNKAILQILSDVFNLEVYALSETSNSACLGGIYRAKHALMGDGKETFRKTVESVPPYQHMCSPIPENHKVYSELLPRYEKLESYLLQQSKAKH